MVGRVHVCISLESCGDLGACAPERMCPTFPTSAFLFKKKSSIALNRMQSSVQLPPPPPLQLDVGGSGEIMRRRVKV